MVGELNLPVQEESRTLFIFDRKPDNCRRNAVDELKEISGFLIG